MAIKFRIPPDQIPDLETIRDLGGDTLQRVINHLGTLEKLPLRPAELLANVTEALDGNAEHAESVVRPLLTLNQLIRQRVRTVDGVLEGLRNGVVLLPGWSADQKAAWQSIEPQLRQLFQVDAIRTVSKATDLAYDHANLFQGARIVTDIRPVFNDLDDDQLAIDGAVVSYTLRLHFDNREGDHSLSIALDEADILVLKDQCERALRKAKIAFDRMSHPQTAGIPTVISGEDTNESD